MTDALRQFHLLLALDEDSLDVAAHYGESDADFVKTDTGIASGMFGEKGKHPVVLYDAVRDGAPQMIGKLDSSFSKQTSWSHFSRSDLMRPTK